MTKIDKKVEELLAKHPSLTKPEAIKILADKNERKKQKRSEKAERSNAKKLKNEENRPEPK
ncbi:MAG: hypothetical protein COA90_09185 [Gammaproteobacteria bacterium]|nr:MAG: hypothetical protein COA90_09185 [Gammaproteobacteria bacterium]